MKSLKMRRDTVVVLEVVRSLRQSGSELHVLQLPIHDSKAKYSFPSYNSVFWRNFSRLY